MVLSTAIAVIDMALFARSDECAKNKRYLKRVEYLGTFNEIFCDVTQRY